MSVKQAIAGVSPAEREETTIMIVWPSIAAYGLGRFIGRLLNVKWPDILFVRLGVFLAPPLIPIALALYFFRLAPSLFGVNIHGKFYKLTNRRVMELRNEITPQFRFVYGAELKTVQLDRFDSIEVVVRPGQQWYAAGDLVFRDGATETFRLEGVSRPEAFRQACLKARAAYVGVKKAREREMARA